MKDAPSSDVTHAASGARPIGTTDEASAARSVQSMFDGIAPRYDLLNHVLSLGVDSLWRRRVARTFCDVLRQPDARILDLCCGTGDLALAFNRWRPKNSEPIIAADFSHQMLLRAQRKFAGRNIRTLEADAMHLPLADSSINLAVSAFGFRNLVNYRDALRELHRVLAPGGQLGILEASEPQGALGRLYRVYFHTVLPKVGAAISHNADAYRYLPASVQRFPAPPALLATMNDIGFSAAQWTVYTFGIASLFRATKPAYPSVKSLYAIS